MSGSQGLGGGEEWEMTANGYKVSFQGDETSLELVVMVARPLNTLKTTELSALKL